MKTNMPGSELMFTVVQKDTHYCGGTDKGCQYLEQAPWIPYSFLGSIAPKPGKMCVMSSGVITLTCVLNVQALIP